MFYFLIQLASIYEHYLNKSSLPVSIFKNINELLLGTTFLIGNYTDQKRAYT